MTDQIGSSIITAIGAGSGINFSQLASDLSEASFDFQRESLEARNEALLTQISAASTLRSNLTEFASAFGDRVRTGSLAPQAKIGDPSIAQVSSALGTSPSGSYSLEVTQLATQQSLVLPSFASSSDLVGEGTFRIRFGTISGTAFTPDAQQAAVEIAVGPQDTLADLASRIRSQSNGALETYVAQGTSGAQLVIKGLEGSANGFVLETTSAAPAPTNAPGDLNYLAWSAASDNGQLRSTAQDAQFMLDTVAMQSASNRVTGLPEGMILELSRTNSGNPTIVEFAQDSSAITAVMNDTVAALNGIVELLGSGSGGAALLSSDSGARNLRRDLSSLTTQIVMPGAVGSEPKTLGDLGLSLNRDGTFQLDTARLARTLDENPEAASAMFTTGPFGVFATIDGLARENAALGDFGSLGGSLTRYEAQVERNDARLERVAEQQERLRLQLVRSFGSAESRISASQSTLSFIRQQFEISDDS